MHHIQTVSQMFGNTRGGKAQRGRCECCNEILGIDEVNVCQDCEFQGQLEEERDN